MGKIVLLVWRTHQAPRCLIAVSSMSSYEADSHNSICFGGGRWGAYLRRKDRANSFANRESSSVLIITHVWKHNEVSESGFTTTPSARKPRAAGWVRMATPTCSDTR